MNDQVTIEALQAPLEAAPEAVPRARTFVRELAEGDDIAAVFAVRERERRTRRNGDDFIRLVVADRTGPVEAVAWEGVDQCFACSTPGDVVFIEGRFSVHPQYGAKITVRTIRAAMDVLADYGRPRAVQLAALVDRGRRELPIQPDYVGVRLQTGANQSVRVMLAEKGEADRVVLRERVLGT